MHIGPKITRSIPMSFLVFFFITFSKFGFPFHSETYYWCIIHKCENRTIKANSSSSFSFFIIILHSLSSLFVFLFICILHLFHQFSVIFIVQEGMRLVVKTVNMTWWLAVGYTGSSLKIPPFIFSPPAFDNFVGPFL